MSLRSAILITAVAVICWGCGGGGAKNPPNGAIRFFHAAPGEGLVRFRRVERSQADLVYKGDSGVISVDGDTYTFNIDLVRILEEERALSFTRSIEPDTEYSYVLYENAGVLDFLEYQKPTPDLADGTDSEVQLFHLAAALGAVDVYLEAPETDIAAATPWGLADFTERLDPQLRPGGDYQLTLTTPNTATVVFSSTPFTLSEASNVSFSVVEGSGAGPALLSVVVSAGGGSAELFDENQQSAMRVFHGARTSGPLDVVLEEEFATPLYPGVAFGAITDYESVPAGSVAVAVTPAGNPGVLEVDQVFQVPEGSALTLLLLGEPGAITLSGSADDNRRFPSLARLRLFNQSTAFFGLDYYVVPPGTDITTQRPTIPGQQSGSATGYLTFLPGVYDLVITEVAGDTPLAGPTLIQLDAAGLYSGVILDGADMATVEVFWIDDPIP